jgi:nitroreductase
MKVSEAILSRRSMRVFTSEPVAEEAIRRILDVAKHAASNTNCQPWHLYVTIGAARRRLSAAILEAIETNEPPAAEYHIHRHPIPEPYRGRQVTLGKALYGMLGIPKGDGEGMMRQARRNFLFFDAPVGMILTMDRRHGEGQWIDCGSFLASVMLVAREEGLHTCPQAAFANYHKVLRRELSIPDNEIVLCGIALGHADEAAVPNTLKTDRAPLEDWVTWFRA